MGPYLVFYLALAGLFQKVSTEDLVIWKNSTTDFAGITLRIHTGSFFNEAYLNLRSNIPCKIGNNTFTIHPPVHRELSGIWDEETNFTEFFDACANQFQVEYYGFYPAMHFSEELMSQIKEGIQCVVDSLNTEPCQINSRMAGHMIPIILIGSLLSLLGIVSAFWAIHDKFIARKEAREQIQKDVVDESRYLLERPVNSFYKL